MFESNPGNLEKPRNRAAFPLEQLAGADGERPECQRASNNPREVSPVTGQVASAREARDGAVASRAEDSRSERPRRDLLRQEPVRLPGGETERSTATSGATALPRTLPRPYYLATIDTSVESTWRQQDRKQRHFHSPVRRARLRNLTRSRICMDGRVERLEMGESWPLGSRARREQAV